MMKVVSVKFKSNGSTVYNSREYYYKTFFDVEAGDQVVVDTSTVGLNIAMIYNPEVTDPTLQKKATKYLVQPIDMEKYKEVIEKEKELCNLKKAMDARVKSLQETAMYEMLAKEDEELADLLITYKEKLAEL